GTLIGGTEPGAGNVIGGNGVLGVLVTQSRDNLVEQNFIGLAPPGAAPAAVLPNGLGGVGLLQASNTAVGGNVISGNRGYGLSVSADACVLQGNFIGTDAAGTAAVPNTGDGVDLSSSTSTTVGGTAPGTGNVISGNGGYGVLLNS